MRKALIFLLVLFEMTHFARPQELAIPTVRILPEDVIQNSIQQFRFTTNKFAVRWTYTEAGAKKMLTFWEQHNGEKVCTAAGDFETQPAVIKFRPIASFTNYTAWKEG